jgi:hypothetical protein
LFAERGAQKLGLCAECNLSRTFAHAGTHAHSRVHDRTRARACTRTRARTNTLAQKQEAKML